MYEKYGIKIKLTKESEKLAMSLFMPVEIVFYKDESGKHYRLETIHDGHENEIGNAFHLAMHISNFAPEIIEGKISKDYEEVIHVKVNEKTYVLEKNAEKFKFWDITKRFKT